MAGGPSRRRRELVEPLRPNRVVPRGVSQCRPRNQEVRTIRPRAISIPSKPCKSQLDSGQPRRLECRSASVCAPLRRCWRARRTERRRARPGAQATRVAVAPGPQAAPRKLRVEPRVRRHRAARRRLGHRPVPPAPGRLRAPRRPAGLLRPLGARVVRVVPHPPPVPRGRAPRRDRVCRLSRMSPG
jgi:hypothetical protein